jgi:hypothetical protein
LLIIIEGEIFMQTNKYHAFKKEIERLIARGYFQQLVRKEIKSKQEMKEVYTLEELAEIR